jgi:Ca2+-binding RTX toxin-like protein
MKRLGMALTIVMTCAVGSAEASTLSLEPDGHGGIKASYLAAAGETNNVTVSQDTLATQSITVSDPGAAITVAQGNQLTHFCVALTKSTVRCTLLPAVPDRIFHLFSARLGDGSDTISAPLYFFTDVEGGPGADRITASNGRVSGEDGADTLALGRGTADGGPGDDTLTATGATSDVPVLEMLGGDGDDRFVAASVSYGDAYAKGGPGDDFAQGGASWLYFDGGPGADAASGDPRLVFDYSSRTAPVTVTADAVADDGEAGEGDLVPPGARRVWGGSGPDDLSIREGTVVGFGGDDTLRLLVAGSASGGDGDDRLFGGPGSDGIDGGPGNDYVDPGAGEDSVYNEAGTDEIHVTDGARDDVMCGPGQADRVFRDPFDLVRSFCLDVTDE